MLKRVARLTNPRSKLQEVDTLVLEAQASGPGSAEAANSQVKAPEGQISEIENELNASKDQPVSVVLSRLVQQLRLLTGADGAAIAILDQWGIVCRASTGNAPAVGSRVQPDSELTRKCFETGQVVVCEDAENDSRIRSSIAKNLRLRSLVVVPIMAQGSVVGVVEVLSERPSAFDSTDVSRLLRINLLVAPILAPTPALSEKHEGDVKAEHAWLIIPVSTFLLLALLIFFLAENPRRLVKAPSRAAVSSPSGLAEGTPKMTEPGASAREGLKAQDFGNQGRPSRAEIIPPTPLSSNAGEKQFGTMGSSKLRSTPERPSEILPSIPVSSSAADVAAPKNDSSTTGKPDPVEPLISIEPGKIPMLAFQPPIPAPVRSTNASIPDFVPDRTLKGHSSWVTSVAFSADGRRLASGSWDQTVKFWDVATGQELLSAAGNMKEVQAIAFSRDGRWLATENSFDKVTLWDATTGREVRTLPSDKALGIPGRNWVYSIAFSPDGRWLASGVDDKTVRLWNVETGEAVRDFVALRRSVIYAAFSPDGHWLASGGDDKTIQIWDISNGHEVRRLSGHKKSIYAIAFSPNGRWLASGSADKTVKLWDVSTGREIHTLSGHENVVTSIAFSADGRWLASGSWDKTIKIWNVDTGHEVQTLLGHSHVYAVAFDSRAPWLASGSEDGTIQLWRVGEGAAQSRLP